MKAVRINHGCACAARPPGYFFYNFANAKPLLNSSCGAREYPIKQPSWTKCGSYVEGARTTAVDRNHSGASPTDVSHAIGTIKGLDPHHFTLHVRRVMMHLQTENLAAESTDCDLLGSHGLVRACMHTELTGTDFAPFEGAKGDFVYILCALEGCWDRLKARGWREEVGP
jgi:hypothetical protein